MDLKTRNFIINIAYQYYKAILRVMQQKPTNPEPAITEEKIDLELLSITPESEENYDPSSILQKDIFDNFDSGNNGDSIDTDISEISTNSEETNNFFYFVFK